MIFEGKRVLVTGGTGSLGQAIVRRILRGDEGRPKRVVVFSRDEAKQDAMRLELGERLAFLLGDVRDYDAVAAAMRCADIVINAAALKQVPSCEYAPYQAVLTNVVGAENIARAIEQLDLPVETVVAVSTDKACKPVNTMGMTKALQERICIQANLRHPTTRFVCVRYGNVLASRGSVIPLFLEQIANGGPVTVTTTEMTRFLLPLEEAVDTVFAAISGAQRGEIYVPNAPSARVVDIAAVLIGGRAIETHVIGIRPGEKVHEIMVSEEEIHRVHKRSRWFAIAPMLPELEPHSADGTLTSELSSANSLVSTDEITRLLAGAMLLPPRGGQPLAERHSNC
jgi:UDP-glucose 4-epimerase